jgi:hypothetical protein
MPQWVSRSNGYATPTTRPFGAAWTSPGPVGPFVAFDGAGVAVREVPVPVVAAPVLPPPPAIATGPTATAVKTSLREAITASLHYLFRNLHVV